jgi:hypothetical protein
MVRQFYLSSDDIGLLISDLIERRSTETHYCPTRLRKPVRSSLRFAATRGYLQFMFTGEFPSNTVVVLYVRRSSSRNMQHSYCNRKQNYEYHAVRIKKNGNLKFVTAKLTPTLHTTIHF